MTLDMSRFLDVFFEESDEHLQTLERDLLRLEQDPGATDLLHAIFRAAHSLKGASGTFGLTEVARFTHVLENLLDRLREGLLPVTPARTSLLLRATDVLREIIASARDGSAVPAAAEAVRAELQAALDDESPAAAPPTADAAPAVAPAGTVRTWTVQLTPGDDLLLCGMDPQLLLRDLAALGTIRSVVVDAGRLPPLRDLATDRCWLAWTVTLESTCDEAAIRDVFVFVEESVALVITAAAPPVATTDPAATPSAAPTLALVREAGEAPAGERRTTPDRRGNADATSIRVATRKVDDLINLVGELVIAQSMVNDTLANFTPERLAALQEAVANMERNMRDLQERVMSVRMVPVSTVFGRFPRLVRDLAQKVGKQIRLEIVGDETELDKTVVEHLGDPLTHLLRNSIDHGLEEPAERRAAGKSEEGVVRLSASHEAGSVVIEIQDDGRGLDTQRIRRKGIEQGIIREEDELTDDQIHALIFAPGFSTASSVSDLSGRGVGMDVVKRAIEELSGTLSIRTERGVGTTFRFKLPLTLAILDGLSMRVADQTYILPLLSIVESLKPTERDVRTVSGRGELIVVRNEPLPLLRLHELFGVPGAETEITRGLVVIVEHAGGRIGLLVDELLGQSQVVIKSLESNYRRVDGVMGATICGDGRAALILDVPGLLRLGHLAAAA